MTTSMALSMALDALLSELLVDPTSHARAHHAAGGRVIGFIGADVPVELILAADALPFCLTGFAGRPTPQADAYLESSFAPLERSIAEQWLSGELRFLSSVVLSRARDSSQRLYYYICELQRRGLCPGPQALLYDVAKIQRETSLAHTVGATRRLADVLGSSPTAIAGCVEIRNRRRGLLRDLQGVRYGAAAPPDGSLVERVMRVSDQGDAGRFDGALGEWLETLATAGSAVGAFAAAGSGLEASAAAGSGLGALAAAGSGVGAVADSRHGAGAALPARLRIVLAGSAPPDDRLHLAIERAGGCVVAEYGDHAVGRLGGPVVTSGDALQAVAAHYHGLGYGPRMFGDRASELVTVAQSSGAAAVVLWLVEEEEALIWDLPGQLQALAAASIPALVLTRRRWDAGDDALDRIRAFVIEQGGGA
jgi:hypothetical protein